MFPFPSRSRTVNMISFDGEGGGNSQLNIILDVVVSDSIEGTPQPPTNCLRTSSSSPSYLSLTGDLIDISKRMIRHCEHGLRFNPENLWQQPPIFSRRRVIKNVGSLDGCANALKEKVDALMSCMSRVHAAQKDDDMPPIEAILAPLEAELKLARQEIAKLPDDNKALDRLTKSKEAALLEAEKTLHVALAKASMVDDLQNKNQELMKQIENCQVKERVQ